MKAFAEMSLKHRDFSSQNDIKFETFTVKYKTRSKNACYLLVDSLTNPTDPNIRAALSLCNCEQTPPQIRGAMNYEALKLVSNE